MNNPVIQNITLPPEPPRTALGASLRADYDALKNDLEQAQELAADFQRQLAGKSNEVAHFKVLLEQMQKDFARLQGHIDELRQERHRLANEVMRVTALDAQLHRKNEELDRLRDQLETLSNASSQRIEELLVVSDEQQREISRLRAMVEVFRRQANAKGTPAGAGSAEAEVQIADLKATVKRLQGRLKQAEVAPEALDMSDPELHADVINLSFER